MLSFNCECLVQASELLAADSKSKSRLEPTTPALSRTTQTRIEFQVGYLSMLAILIDENSTDKVIAITLISWKKTDIYEFG